MRDHIAKNCPSKRKLADNETNVRPAKLSRQENSTNQAGFGLPTRGGPVKDAARGTQRPQHFRENRGYRGHRGRESSQDREGYRAGYSAALENIADVYDGNNNNNNVNSSVDSENISMFRVGSKENCDGSKNIVAKFISDSGATEHLSKSLLFFDNFNETNESSIKCANKESSLNTTGVGQIKAYMNKHKKLVLNDV